MKKVVLVLFVSTVFFFACKKSTTSSDTSKLFTYNGLSTDHDSIAKGNVTNIRANVSGTATYAWSANAGDIFGSGGVILFGASTCCVGNHTITCKVSDTHNNTETKTVIVKVY